jgi:hypothetical protein
MAAIHMRDLLADDRKIAALKIRLQTYPGTTAEHADDLIDLYKMRVSNKEGLLEQGLSNAGAETFLDRKGYPRPPGWHSVFFYPDSMRPRNSYVVLALLIAASIWLFF